MSNKRVVLIILVSSLFVLALGVGPGGSDAARALPQGKEPATHTVTIPYPGRLSDESGQLVADGAYDFSFALYAVESAGEQLWSEVQESIKVLDGGFITSIGSIHPIPATLMEGDRTLWLAIGVRGPGEVDFTMLVPRQRLSTSTSIIQNSSTAGLTCDHDHWNETWSGSGTGLTLSSSDSRAMTGRSTTNWGVYGVGGNAGVVGETIGEGTDLYGVYGTSINGTGVYGNSTNGYGVQGYSNEHGVYGETNGNYAWRSGVFGRATNDDANGVTGWNDFNGVGVYGFSNKWAGYFNGDVNVTGYLYKSGGGFKIDHPLDPENQYLYHSFVESPDMKNVYDGVVILDADGTAWVELPEWFEAVNKDFRYQLTPIGASAPDLHIAQEIESNRFHIAGGEPGLKISWQVTGIRHDLYAEAHPMAVEEAKPPEEQGTYLHPAEYGKPRTEGLDYQRNQTPEQFETGGE